MVVIMQHRFWSGIVLASLVLSAAQTTAVAAEPSEGQSGGQAAWLSRAGARAEPEAIQPLHLLQHQQGFQRAHEILAQTRGQSSSPYPAEVQQWQQQAKALMEQGRYQEAVQLQDKVVAWTEQHLGHDQFYTATSLNNLAELYQNQGAYAKAEPLYIRALAIFEKALGSNHPITITVRENLEQCRKARGDRGADFSDFTAGRELWFKMTASQAKISSSAEFPHVFIVIMDWRIENKQTLIAAAADGTSSLYISPGSKVLGGYSAKEEAKAVITAAEKILTLAKKVSDHPLPPPGEVRFYIRTHSGLYMISDSFADLRENKGKTLQLFVAANKVMTVHLDTIDAESKPFYRK